MPKLSRSITSLSSPAADERLLSATANLNKAKLRILQFRTYDDDLFAWKPCAEAQPARAVLGQSLRRLRALDGDLFPAPRMHWLWAAVTAANAQEGAVPLTRFRTLVARDEVPPLAHFLDASGAQLLAPRLDFRLDSSWRVQNTADAGQSAIISRTSPADIPVHLQHRTRAGSGSSRAPACAASKPTYLAPQRTAPTTSSDS
ncbi:hypothetical protein PsYK624_122660 [Phanerochaete sordida]|uniref:Uncharacterized protein n=1 Tax=Phanerochaete sordida TaxID=48140 RepID=A0A9P3LIE7_9APHY|nr:hypothetical protein PsYK624_122660 [Phanerochaete sordida]